MKYAIAIVAMQDDDMEERTLQLFGPFEAEARAQELAGYMQARLDKEMTAAYVATGIRFYAVVIPQHPVKVKHAVTVAQAFLKELEQDQDDELLSGFPAPAYRQQEVVGSVLLNGPV